MTILHSISCCSAMDPANGLFYLIPQDGDAQVEAPKSNNRGAPPTAVTDVCAGFVNAVVLTRPQDASPRFIGSPSEMIRRHIEDLYDRGQLIDTVTFGASYGFAELASDDIVGFGSNEFGQLGTGGLGVADRPQVVDCLKRAGVVHNSTDQTAPTPKRTSVLVGGNRRPLEVMQIACGFDHTMVLTADGCVYTSGNGLLGQLGTGVKAQASFACVKSLVGVDSSSTQKCVKIAAGHGFSAAVTDKGVLMMWGSGSQYQLGTGKPKTEQRPVCVPVGGDHASDESGVFVHEVSCGSGHVAVIAGVNRQLYTWGQSAHGQTGHADCSVQKAPRLVEELRHLSMASVKCSRASACVLTDEGSVYVMGSPYFSPTLISLKELGTSIVCCSALLDVVLELAAEGRALSLNPAAQLQTCDMRAVASTGSHVVFHGAGIQYSESAAPIVRFSCTQRNDTDAQTVCCAAAMHPDGSLSCTTPDYSACLPSSGASSPLVASVAVSLDDGRSFSLPMDIAVFRNSPRFPSAPRPRLASILGGDSIELPVDPRSIDCAVVYNCLRVRLAEASDDATGTASTKASAPIEVEAEFLPSKSAIRFVVPTSLRQADNTKNDEENATDGTEMDVHDGNNAADGIEMDVHVALDGQHFIETNQSLHVFDARGLCVTPQSVPLIGGRIEIRCTGLDVPFEERDLRIRFCHGDGMQRSVAASARKAEHVVPKLRADTDNGSSDKTIDSLKVPPGAGGASDHEQPSENVEGGGECEENEEESANDANKVEDLAVKLETDEEAAQVVDAGPSEESGPDSSCLAGSTAEETREETLAADDASSTQVTEDIEGVFVVSCDAPSLLPLTSGKCTGHTETWALEISLNGTAYVPLDLLISFTAPTITSLRPLCVLRTTTPAAASDGGDGGGGPDALVLNVLGDHLFPELKPRIEFWTAVQKEKEVPSEAGKEESAEATDGGCDEPDTANDASQAELENADGSTQENGDAGGVTSREEVEEVIATLSGRVLTNGMGIECDLARPSFINEPAEEPSGKASARSTGSADGDASTKLEFCNVRVHFDGADVESVSLKEQLRIYDQPMVTKVKPLSGPVDAPTEITLIGTGFFDSKYIALRFTYASDDVAFSKTVPLKLAPLPDEVEDTLEAERTLTCDTPSFTISEHSATTSGEESVGGDTNASHGEEASKGSEGASGGDAKTTSGGDAKALESGSKISLELAMNGKQFVQIPKFQFTVK